MTPDMGLMEAIDTTRAIRKFKPDSVPDELLHQVLAAAGQAPSGNNSQPWRFIVLRSEGAKQRIRERLERPQDGPLLAVVPVIVLVCSQRRTPGPADGGLYAPVMPAAQNLLLAARALGLGGNLTMAHRGQEEQLKKELGVPDDVEIDLLIPLGYPDGSRAGRHGKKTRMRLDELTHEERWGQAITF
jgi:nitroreductase